MKVSRGDCTLVTLCITNLYLKYEQYENPADNLVKELQIAKIMFARNRSLAYSKGKGIALIL